MHVIMNTLGRASYGATDYTNPASFYTAPPNYVMQSSGNAPPASSGGSWTKTATYDPAPESVPVGNSAGSVSWADVGATFLRSLGSGIQGVVNPQTGAALTPDQLAALQAAQANRRSGIPDWAIYALIGVPVVGAAAWAVTRKPKSSSAPAMAGYRRKKHRKIKRAR